MASHGNMWHILYSLWGQEHFLTLNHSTSVCPSCERRLETHTFHKLRNCCCWRCDYSVVPDLKMIWIWLDFLATGWRLTGLLNHPTIKRLYPSFFYFESFLVLTSPPSVVSAGNSSPCSDLSRITNQRLKGAVARRNQGEREQPGGE